MNFQFCNNELINYVLQKYSSQPINKRCIKALAISGNDWSRIQT